MHPHILFPEYDYTIYIDGCFTVFSDVTPFIRPLEGGYALNTGSIGNNLSLARAHALLLEGEAGPAPLYITVLSVPYDNRKAAERAELYPELPLRESYQKEVLTGQYSR